MTTRLVDGPQAGEPRERDEAKGGFGRRGCSCAVGIWVSIAETCADDGKFLQGGWKRVGYSGGHKECLVPGAMYTVPPHPRPPSPRTPGQHMCRCIYHRGMLDGQLISHLRC